MVKAKNITLPGRTALPRMTYEEFLAWADEDTLAEWVDGKVEMMSPASARHQDLTLFLARLLGEYAEERGAGKALIAPFQMKLDSIRRGREPDLIFITEEHLPRLQTNLLDGPADLAIEIISPESVVCDRGVKFIEYEAGGVREYWTLDPEARRADFFVLDSEGRYGRAAPDAEGRYESAVLPGFWISVGWLWQSPLPPVRLVRREWENGLGE